MKVRLFSILCLFSLLVLLWFLVLTLLLAPDCRDPERDKWTPRLYQSDPHEITLQEAFLRSRSTATVRILKSDATED